MNTLSISIHILNPIFVIMSQKEVNNMEREILYGYKKLTDTEKNDRYWNIKSRLTHNSDYQDITMCDEWNNDMYSFYNFLDRNYYTIKDLNEATQIDKDIKNKGNKVYSPESCIIVPRKINLFFSNCSGKNGLPPGVKLDSESGKYFSRNDYDVILYDSPEEAFNIWKQSKEEKRIQLLNEYYNNRYKKIPEFIAEAVSNYQFSIDD